MSKILIIESDGDFSAGLRADFEARGFEVVETQDGKKAVDTAKAEGPDLVVLAVELSAGQSGYILCGKLKKDEQTQSIPVIIVGSDEKGFEGHRKLKTRAEGYLKKPFESEQLLGMIGELIGLPETAGASGEVAIEEDEPLAGIEEPGETVSGEVRADPEFEMLDAAFEDASSPEAAEEPQAISEVEEVPVEEVPVELPSEESAAAEEAAEESALEGFSESAEADVALDGLSESAEEIGAVEPLDEPLDPPSEVSEALSLDEAPIEEALEEATPLEEGSGLDGLGSDPDAVTTMETTLGADGEELASLRTRVEELEAELASAHSGGGRDKDVFALKDQLSKKDKELLRLKQELNDKDKELVELRERETELEQKLSGGAGEVARRDAQIKTLTQRVETFGAEKKKLEVAVQASKEEARQATSKLSAAKADVQRLDEQLKAAQEQLSELQARGDEAEELRRKMAELEDRNSRNEERVVKAYQKIKGDEKLKDKTKKALAIALQLLEEQAAAAAIDSDVDEGPAVQDEEAQA